MILLNHSDTRRLIEPYPSPRQAGIQSCHGDAARTSPHTCQHPLQAITNELSRVQHSLQKEKSMRSQRTRVKQSIALAGLTLALVVSGAAPLLDGHGVEAARKGKKQVGAENGHAQLVQSLSNPTPITINEGSNANPAASTPYGTAIEV